MNEVLNKAGKHHRLASIESDTAVQQRQAAASRLVSGGRDLL